MASKAGAPCTITLVLVPIGAGCCVEPCGVCFKGRRQEKGEDSSLYVKANQQPSNHILKGVYVFVGVRVPGITEADIIPFVIQKMWKGKGRNSSCSSILGSVKIHCNKYSLNTFYPICLKQKWKPGPRRALSLGLMETFRAEAELTARTTLSSCRSYTKTQKVASKISQLG